MTTILDYGMGNLRSVQKALEFLGHTAVIQPHLEGTTKLIIPGVGAFGAAMERIGPLREEIRAFAASGKPVLGICLGMQLLLDESEELGTFTGLGLVPGKVKYFPADMGLKVPHTGWNTIEPTRADGLLDGFATGDQVYFVHSLYTDCANPADVAATCQYGMEFACSIEHENVWGTQFHPEKSGAVGLRMLRNFVEC
ncbi:MAG: imidazole glycerol phosphate synthase subunit HisH [Fimbriimonas sp.]